VVHGFAVKKALAKPSGVIARSAALPFAYHAAFRFFSRTPSRFLMPLFVICSESGGVQTLRRGSENLPHMSVGFDRSFPNRKLPL
jgi:hypothetical protein